MLLGTRAMMPRPCAECTATGRRSRATFTDWFLITPLRRRSMTVKSPSRACQVSVDIVLRSWLSLLLALSSPISVGFLTFFFSFKVENQTAKEVTDMLS